MSIIVGQILRYPAQFRVSEAIIDDLPNFYVATATPGTNAIKLDSGIWQIAMLNGVDGPRRPAIVVSSTPHKVGRASTPWLDIFDLDNGHVRYLGDNKTPGKDPSMSRGNAAMLAEFRLHSAPDALTRALAAPIVIFRRIVHDGRPKGYIEFWGVAVIERVERITQVTPRDRLSFANYAYDLAVLSLAGEAEQFDWAWISARRRPDISARAALELAPTSWKSWVTFGSAALPQVRRRVSRLQVIPRGEQMPTDNSKESAILHSVYRRYSSRRHHFEGVAAKVTARLLMKQGTYTEGWLTIRAGDGGTDFVGRLDVGEGFAKTKLVVLGQAKCESDRTATGGNHVARTVARLKRGWIGAYVTTSYFSRAVQEEIIEDQYPIILINGLQVAQTIHQILLTSGISLDGFFAQIESEYESSIANRRPEEILAL